VGHQIVKQPDGRLAIFSVGTNSWLVWDATPEEIVEYYAERAADSARDSARRTVQHVMDDEPRKAYYQFTETFEHLNAIVKACGESSDGPEGPVDEATYREWFEQRELPVPADRIDNHLIFGAGQDAPPAQAPAGTDPRDGYFFH
jgi:hypothetical protein